MISCLNHPSVTLLINPFCQSTWPISWALFLYSYYKNLVVSFVLLNNSSLVKFSVLLIFCSAKLIHESCRQSNDIRLSFQLRLMWPCRRALTSHPCWDGLWESVGIRTICDGTPYVYTLHMQVNILPPTHAVSYITKSARLQCTVSDSPHKWVCVSQHRL